MGRRGNNKPDISNVDNGTTQDIFLVGIFRIQNLKQGNKLMNPIIYYHLCRWPHSLGMLCVSVETQFAWIRQEESRLFYASCVVTQSRVIQQRTVFPKFNICCTRGEMFLETCAHHETNFFIFTYLKSCC